MHTIDYIRNKHCTTLSVFPIPFRSPFFLFVEYIGKYFPLTISRKQSYKEMRVHSNMLLIVAVPIVSLMLCIYT